MENIVEIRNLTKKFGSYTAVNSISFNIKRGEILGFLGPNGAGKTTTIKMIMGLIRITEGEIKLKGLDLKKSRQQAKRHLGYMSQKFSLYPALTPQENLEFFGGISGLSRSMIEHKRKEMTKSLSDKMSNMKVKDLPPGIRQKTALNVAMIAEPDIIVLDEPTSGVDPEIRREFWYEIYKLKERGKTILVTTHNLDEVEYTDRLLILHYGNLLVEGELNTLLKQHDKQSINHLFSSVIEGADIK